MIVLGIDPGSVSAAWGVIDPDKGYSCGDIPVADNMVDGNGFANMVAAIGASHAIVEKVGSFPGQGVSSSFRFGMGTGIIHGVLAALATQRILVAPTVWKKHFGLDKDKEKSRALALQRFPAMASKLSRKIDAGRAEALLIALWWLEQNR